MLSSSMAVHQRAPGGARVRPESIGSEAELQKTHARHHRPSVSVFDGTSAFSFAVAGVVLLLLVIGAVIMLSDTSGPLPIEDRIAAVPGRSTKLSEDGLRRKISGDESADEYAARVRERYQARVNLLREQELKRLEEEAARKFAEERGAQQQQAQYQQAPPDQQQINQQQWEQQQQQQAEQQRQQQALQHQAEQQQAQQQQAQQQQAEQQRQQQELEQRQQAEQQYQQQQQAAPPAQQAVNQASLEQSLAAIQEQLARLQQGFQQKQVEQQPPPPINPPADQIEAQRQAELQDLVNKMNELRAQSATLESLLQQPNSKQSQ